MATASLAIINARADKIRFDIPEKAYQAFRSQCHSAKRRGIAMEFTFKEWWEWWQIDDNWSKRGQGKTGLCMARNGDKGPYRKDNVHCATISTNSSETVQQPGSHHSGNYTYHFLGVTGDNHPKSRAVITPKGRFGSIALAAAEYGLTRAGGKARADNLLYGWKYE